MELFKKTHFDFIGFRWFPISVSFIILFGGLAIIMVKGFNFGIEFTGGALLQVSFEKPVSMEDVRASLTKRELSSEIQSVNLAGRSAFIIRHKGTEERVQNLANELVGALNEGFPGNKPVIERKEFIGPVIGQHLKSQTLWAITLSLLGIIVYVGFRFSNPLWGLAGLIALAHDVIGTAAMISLTGKEMDLLIVSALLTVAGYSIEDTIVIYDRMREMNRIMYKEPLDKIINVSLNDTLSRTVITVLLVQIICIVLWLMGGELLKNFGLALVVGNILGSYSSIAVAAPLVYEWDRRMKGSRVSLPAQAPKPQQAQQQGKKKR
ncbi:MAG: protein translocase subunit SecF [Elusimicrobia bacterium]|nr:protein translocase subunit SecF [Elusimicrobiota bacterium]